MNLDNFICLSNLIKGIGSEHAERYNNGISKGTFRRLNLSYNPFLRKGEVYKGPNLQMIDHQFDHNTNE